MLFFERPAELIQAAYPLVNQLQVSSVISESLHQPPTLSQFFHCLFQCDLHLDGIFGHPFAVLLAEFGHALELSQSVQALDFKGSLYGQLLFDNFEFPLHFIHLLLHLAQFSDSGFLYLVDPLSLLVVTHYLLPQLSLQSLDLIEKLCLLRQVVIL